MLRSAVSSVSQCGLTRHTKINLKCLIFTTTLLFSSLSPVWDFKDQTHSMWCFVYTVWCHHTNLARQFRPKASSFMERRASTARSLSVSVSYWNPDDEMCRGNIYKHTKQYCRRGVDDTGALTLLTEQTRHINKTSAADGLSLSTCLTKWLKCTFKHRKPLITARQRGVKFRMKWKERLLQWGNPSTLYLDYMETRSNKVGKGYSLLAPYWILLESIGGKLTK